jgi:hypothetical protein
MSFLFRVVAVLAFLALIRYAFEQGMTHALQTQTAAVSDSATPQGIGFPVNADGCSVGDTSPHCNANTGRFDGTVPSQ